MKAHEEPTLDSKRRPAHRPTREPTQLDASAGVIDATDAAIQTGEPGPRAIKPVALLNLQRTAGNQAVIKYVKGKASASQDGKRRDRSLAPEVAESESHGELSVTHGEIEALSWVGAEYTPGWHATSSMEQEAKEESADEAPLQRSYLQRDDAPSSGITETAPTDSQWSQYREEMEIVRANATARELQAEACVGLAAEVLSSLRTHLESVSAVYGTAYKQYSEVIEKGKAAAKTEEELIDVGVGILLAVAVGTGVGAGAIALHVEEAVAIEAAKEALTASAAEGLKAVVKHNTGWMEVAGTELEPGGLKPEMMKLHLWEQMVDLHSAVLATIKQTELQSLIASGAEYAIGEIKAQIGGGGGADLKVAELHDLIGTLANDDAASASLDKNLATAITSLQDVKDKLTGAPDPHGREMEMERDIWILWMADLTEEDAKVLDRDPIEDHLQEMKLITSYYGNGGSLGVDTGIWTTKADCLKMIDAAKEEADALRTKYGSLAG